MNLITQTDVRGSQLAITVVRGMWTLAATGTAAGLLIALVGLSYLLLNADPVRAIGMVAVLGFVAGGCATALVMQARHVDIRRHLDASQVEIERKAQENAKLLARVLENPGSSLRSDSKSTAMLGKADSPATTAAAQKPQREGKRR